MDTIQICNMAIGLCGSTTTILSLDDNTTEAILCKLWFEAARDYSLEARDWTFASHRARITALSDPPAAEYPYQLLLPSDCLVVRFVCESSDLVTPADYQKDGRMLLAFASTLYIRYTRKITDPSQYSSGFSVAVANKLAEHISPTLTGNLKLSQGLLGKTEVMYEANGAVDGMQGAPKRVNSSRLMNARGMGSMWNP